LTNPDHAVEQGKLAYGGYLRKNSDLRCKLLCTTFIWGYLDKKEKWLFSKCKKSDF
jgi:hypothetical protein